MRKDIQKIFTETPQDKQVMMFSATMSPEIKKVCRKFMQNVSRSFQINPLNSSSKRKFSSMMRQSSPSTVSSNTTSTSRKKRRARSWSISWTTCHSTRLSSLSEPSQELSISTKFSLSAASLQSLSTHNSALRRGTVRRLDKGFKKFQIDVKTTHCSRTSRREWWFPLTFSPEVLTSKESTSSSTTTCHRREKKLETKLIPTFTE